MVSKNIFKSINTMHLLDCEKQCAIKTKFGQLKEMSRSISKQKEFTFNISLCYSMNINDIILSKYIDFVLRFQTKTNQKWYSFSILSTHILDPPFTLTHLHKYSSVVIWWTIVCMTFIGKILTGILWLACWSYCDRYLLSGLSIFVWASRR